MQEFEFSRDVPKVPPERLASLNHGAPLRFRNGKGEKRAKSADRESGDSSSVRPEAGSPDDEWDSAPRQQTLFDGFEEADSALASKLAKSEAAPEERLPAAAKGESGRGDSDDEERDDVASETAETAPTDVDKVDADEGGRVDEVDSDASTVAVEASTGDHPGRAEVDDNGALADEVAEHDVDTATAEGASPPVDDEPVFPEGNALSGRSSAESEASPEDTAPAVDEAVAATTRGDVSNDVPGSSREGEAQAEAAVGDAESVKQADDGDTSAFKETAEGTAGESGVDPQGEPDTKSLEQSGTKPADDTTDAALFHDTRTSTNLSDMRRKRRRGKPSEPEEGIQPPEPESSAAPDDEDEAEAVDYEADAQRDDNVYDLQEEGEDDELTPDKAFSPGNDWAGAADASASPGYGNTALGGALPLGWRIGMIAAGFLSLLALLLGFAALNQASRANERIADAQRELKNEMIALTRQVRQLGENQGANGGVTRDEWDRFRSDWRLSTQEAFDKVSRAIETNLSEVDANTQRLAEVQSQLSALAAALDDLEVRGTSSIRASTTPATSLSAGAAARSSSPSAAVSPERSSSVTSPSSYPLPRPPDGLYTIQSGDTLSSVARRYGTTVNAILQENPGIEPRRLRVGQQIQLPR